jgi:AraC-like DNA-binding protein
LRYLFDCPLEYGRSHNEIHIDAELLYQPSSTTLEQVDAMLKDSRWMILVSHKSAPFTREVRKMLILNHETGGLSVEEVAERMSVSKNLLWRRLKKENTNFLDIRDEVKRDIALSSLNDHELSISDIAYKTGFSDLSSFNKAFTKWTGQSPSAYRKSFNRNLT